MPRTMQKFKITHANLKATDSMGKWFKKLRAKGWVQIKYVKYVTLKIENYF